MNVICYTVLQTEQNQPARLHRCGSCANFDSCRLLSGLSAGGLLSLKEVQVSTDAVRRPDSSVHIHCLFLTAQIRCLYYNAYFSTGYKKVQVCFFSDPARPAGAPWHFTKTGGFSQRIKFVRSNGSLSGRPYASFPSAMLFMRNVIFRARVRMLCSPSRSCAASPAALP